MVLSGAPSSAHAVLTGGDVLAATRAAGTLLGAPGVVRGGAAHIGLSVGWTAVLAAVDRRWPLGVPGGAAAGLVIALLDLEVVGRGFPAVRALPRWPQWLDHVAFGALVGWSLAADRRRAGPEPSTVDLTGRSRRRPGHPPTALRSA